ncbi:Outer membrane lipoprotein carrier protein LolA [Fibrobacter intestinalis]|uniref:Outer membrane lipoprotein carrier protein LolA n=1 Tax=Fibrobacter intestinalis TaxID=28122 RepID=A0A1M6Q0W5_9BACT|nr:outer membrane lipoprotein carrier protein LolA [Fibrobacter intestinalis]SHK13803.1 Outer membrane lipoprotein carrier protein LolA [Fibrobacter intestinalis]
MVKIYFTIFLFWSGILFAKDSLWDSPADFNSPAFAEIVQTLSSVKKQEGSFIQKRIVQKIQRVFESSGTFLISGKDGIILNVEKPFASRSEISKEKMIQVFPDGTSVEMNAANNAVFREIAASVQAVFNGNLESLQQKFDIYFVTQKKKWTIGLRPKEKMIQKALASILLEGQKNLEKVEMLDGEGNILSYEFRNSAK